MTLHRYRRPDGGYFPANPMNEAEMLDWTKRLQCEVEKIPGSEQEAYDCRITPGVIEKMGGKR